LSTETKLRSDSINLEKAIRWQDKTSIHHILYGLAIAKEASRRLLGIRPTQNQTLGAAVINQPTQQLLELATGEGKTLAGLMATYLHGLGNKTVHLVTPNDYLTERDYLYSRGIYHYLGLTTGHIESKTQDRYRELQYSKNILYITAPEAVFDSLKDQLNPFHKRQKEVNVAILDEIDSILLDSGETPLILSKSIKRPRLARIAAIYLLCAGLPAGLIKRGKFDAVTLTQKGQQKLEDTL